MSAINSPGATKTDATEDLDALRSLLREEANEGESAARLRAIRAWGLSDGFPDEPFVKHESPEAECTVRGKAWLRLLGVRESDWEAGPYESLVQMGPWRGDGCGPLEESCIGLWSSDGAFSRRVGWRRVARVLHAFAHWVGLRASGLSRARAKVDLEDGLGEEEEERLVEDCERFVVGWERVVGVLLCDLTEKAAFSAFEALQEGWPALRGGASFRLGCTRFGKMLEEVLEEESPDLMLALSRRHGEMAVGESIVGPRLATMLAHRDPPYACRRVWDALFSKGPALVVPLILSEVRQRSRVLLQHAAAGKSSLERLKPRSCPRLDDATAWIREALDQLEEHDQNSEEATDQIHDTHEGRETKTNEETGTGAEDGVWRLEELGIATEPAPWSIKPAPEQKVSPSSTSNHSAASHTKPRLSSKAKKSKKVSSPHGKYASASPASSTSSSGLARVLAPTPDDVVQRRLASSELLVSPSSRPIVSPDSALASSARWRTSLRSDGSASGNGYSKSGARRSSLLAKQSPATPTSAVRVVRKTVLDVHQHSNPKDHSPSIRYRSTYGPSNTLRRALRSHRSSPPSLPAEIRAREEEEDDRRRRGRANVTIVGGYQVCSREEALPPDDDAITVRRTLAQLTKSAPLRSAMQEMMAVARPSATTASSRRTRAPSPPAPLVGQGGRIPHPFHRPDRWETSSWLRSTRAEAAASLAAREAGDEAYYFDAGWPPAPPALPGVGSPSARHILRVEAARAQQQAQTLQAPNPWAISLERSLQTTAAARPSHEKTLPPRPPSPPSPSHRWSPTRSDGALAHAWSASKQDSWNPETPKSKTSPSSPPTLGSFFATADTPSMQF